MNFGKTEKIWTEKYREFRILKARRIYASNDFYSINQ